MHLSVEKRLTDAKTFIHFDISATLVSLKSLVSDITVGLFSD